MMTKQVKKPAKPVAKPAKKTTKKTTKTTTKKPAVKKSKKAEKEKFDEWAKSCKPKLDGQSATVKERFDEVEMIADNNDDFIMLLDGMEKALVGITMNSFGHPVAVYERELCIQCLMENYGKDWAKNLGCYTKEQMKDKEYMEDELRNMAVEDFEYNTIRSLPYCYDHADKNSVPGDHAPIILEGFVVDMDRWIEFKEA